MKNNSFYDFVHSDAFAPFGSVFDLVFSFVNLFFGFFLFWLLWQWFVFPVFGINLSILSAVGLDIFITVAVYRVPTKEIKDREIRQSRINRFAFLVTASIYGCIVHWLMQVV